MRAEVQRRFADRHDRRIRIDRMLHRDPHARALGHAIQDFALLDGGFQLDDAAHRAREPQRAGVIEIGNRGQVPGDAARRDAS